mmetsp:Transcript_124086/g.345393  ORF Transcript_124086/g.345393 Transcript_124086/m.345393 type:complete len:203 (+) Transcript_124086:2540-3148(+)
MISRACTTAATVFRSISTCKGFIQEALVSNRRHSSLYATWSCPHLTPTAAAELHSLALRSPNAQCFAFLERANAMQSVIASRVIHVVAATTSSVPEPVNQGEWVIAEAPVPWRRHGRADASWSFPYFTPPSAVLHTSASNCANAEVLTLVQRGCSRWLVCCEVPRRVVRSRCTTARTAHRAIYRYECVCCFGRVWRPVPHAK